PPSRVANNTGRQSATITTHTFPAVSVIEASPTHRPLCPAGLSTSVPCTCSSQNGESGNASSSVRRTRLASTWAGSSPTCAARLKESQGAVLAPPIRVVNATCTPGGTLHSKSSRDGFIYAVRSGQPPARLTTRRDPPAAAL